LFEIFGLFYKLVKCCFTVLYTKVWNRTGIESNECDICEKVSSMICEPYWDRFGEQRQSVRHSDGLESGQDDKEGMTGTCIVCTDVR